MRVPSGTIATITVIDPTMPTVTITPMVTGTVLSVAVAVTDRTLAVAETITLALSGGPSTPAAQTVPLPRGTTTSGAARTKLFPDLEPGSYTIEATESAPDDINIVYAGRTQQVTIVPLVTIGSAVNRDVMTITATITEGPIGDADVPLTIELLDSSSTVIGRPQTLILASGTNTPRTTTFNTVPSGAINVRASAPPNTLRITNPPATITIPPKVALTLASNTYLTATATARITDGTLDDPVDITAHIVGPGDATADGAIQALSSRSTDQTETATFTGLAPGSWTLDSNSIATPEGILLDISSTAATVVALPMLELTAPSSVILGAAAEVVVSASAVPAGPVTVTITAARDGTSGTPITKAATLNTRNNFRESVEFPTQGGTDLLTEGIYNLSVSVADSTEQGRVTVPSGTLATLTVIDPTLPEVTVTPTVAGNSLSVDVEVTNNRALTAAETITLALSGGPSTPPSQTVTLPIGYDRDDAAHTQSFALLMPGSYTLAATATPGNINEIIYAGGTQAVTILPLVTISSAVNRDVVTITATVSEGPIGDENAELTITLRDSSNTTIGEKIPTLTSGSVTSSTVSAEFPNVPSGDISVGVSADINKVRITNPPAIITIPPKVSLHAPSVLHFGTELQVRVATDVSPIATMVVLVATHSDGTVMTRSIPLTPTSYTNRAATFTNLKPGSYTFTATGTALDTDSARAMISVNPVLVNIVRTPAKAQLTHGQDLGVSARVATPGYSGRIELDLALTGPTTPSHTLTLRGTTPATHTFSGLGSGGYTLHASGTGIETIRDVGFSVQPEPTIAEVDGLIALTGEHTITLQWNDPSDPDLSAIAIEAAGKVPVRVPPGTGSYRLDCLPNGSHNFRVRTIDGADNPSAGVSVTASLPGAGSATRATAQRVPLDATLCARIDNEAEDDWYTVSLAAGRDYLFTMDKAAGSQLDPMLRLYPAEGAGFVADNNGDNPGVPRSDARLLYQAERTGDHHLLLTTGSAHSEADINWTGDYQLQVIEVNGSIPPPTATSGHTPRLNSGQRLTRDIEDYELVWNDEFNASTRQEIDDNKWLIPTYRPRAVSLDPDFAQYIPFQSLDSTDNGRTRYVGWRASLGDTVGFAPYGGRDTLRLAVIWPRYSGLCGEFRWNITNCDKPASERRWRITLPGIDDPILIPDGHIPTLSESDGRSYISYHQTNITGSAPGYWMSRMSTRGKFHTRYGYYELHVNFTDMKDLPGMRLSWWMYGINDTVSYPDEASLRTARYHGTEIDITEFVSSQKDEPRHGSHFKDWMAYFPHGTRQLQVGEIKIRGAERDAWRVIAVEWTPDDICFYRQQRKWGCIAEQDFWNWSDFRNFEMPINQRPLFFAFTKVASNWIYRGLEIHDQFENMDSVAYIDYMRVYKPRDRYGDTEPDNHIIKRPINSEADLQVRP